MSRTGSTPRTSTPLGLLIAVVLAALAALVVLPPGVAHADDGTNGVPPGQAWIRVGHFVPGMGATRIELRPIGGSAQEVMLAGRATYGDVSPYEKIAPGSYTATVSASDAPTGSAPMLSRSFEVTAADARTVAVVGTASAPRLVLLTDDLTPPAAGTARVRLLSAVSSGPVTVRALGGPVIASGAVLGEATSYTTVPAGTWTLRLDGADADVVVRGVPITSGSVYTVAVLGEGGQDARLDVVTDAAGAVVAPRGGAHTGLGGMSTASLVHPVGGTDLGASRAPAAPLAPAALVIVLTGLALVLRRRRRPASARVA